MFEWLLTTAANSTNILIYDMQIITRIDKYSFYNNSTIK